MITHLRCVRVIASSSNAVEATALLASLDSLAYQSSSLRIDPSKELSKVLRQERNKKESRSRTIRAVQERYQSCNQKDIYRIAVSNGFEGVQRKVGKFYD